MSPAVRDPEGRRRAIVAATVQCIADVGVGNVTHRLIARRAGVPLGSTTYYFPTLAALVAAALTEVAAQAQRDADEVRALLLAAEDLPAALRRYLVGFLADRSRAVLEYELYLAAARNEELRPAARVWLDGLQATLCELTDPASARALAALVDGVLVQALVTGEPLDEEALETAAGRLLPTVR